MVGNEHPTYLHGRLNPLLLVHHGLLHPRMVKTQSGDAIETIARLVILIQMDSHDVVALLDGLLVVDDDLAAEAGALGRHVGVALVHLQSKHVVKVGHLLGFDHRVPGRALGALCAGAQ